MIRGFQGGGAAKKRLTTAERWKRKKAGLPMDDAANSADVSKLTGLADALLTNLGHMNVYEETFESIKLKVCLCFRILCSWRRLSSHVLWYENSFSVPFYYHLLVFAQRSEISYRKILNSCVQLAPPEASAPEMDMFGEEEAPVAKRPKVTFSEDNNTATTPGEASSVSSVQWEYRVDSQTTQGPFSTEDMMKKQDDGVFGETGAECRRIGQDKWYNTRRIDFEIYLED